MKKYFVCATDSASDLIPDAEHIERNDELCEQLGITDELDDFEAAKEAQIDGIKLIDNIEGIYPNLYVDSPENRKIINSYLENHSYTVDKIGCYNYEFKGFVR